MTITIAGKSYPARRPSNLDERLMATTGSSAKEIAEMLKGHPIPGQVAAALHPFLGDDAPSVHELAVAIEEHGTRAVASEVAALLAKAPEAAPAKGEK